MEDDDDWGVDDNTKKDEKVEKKQFLDYKSPTEKDQIKRGGRGGRDKNQQVKKEENQDKHSLTMNEADTAQEQPKKQEGSFLNQKSDKEQELTPDEPNVSLWEPESKDKKAETESQTTRNRGNRDNRVEDKKEEEAPSRGNRGNRDTQQSNYGGGNYGDFKKKTYGQEDNEGERPQRGNRDENRGGSFRGGYQGSRGGYQGNRGGYQGGNRQGGNRQGGYQGGNRQGGYQGNRQGGYRGGYQNNRQGDQESRGGYRGRGRGNYSNFGNREGQEDKEGERGNRNYGDNRNYNRNNEEGGNRNHYYDRNQNGNNYNSSQQTNQKPEDKTTQPPAVIKSIEPVATLKQKQKEQMLPKGRKAWPESSIYLLGCKLIITYRQIHEFSSDILVIPYKTTKMEYYPGNVINQFSIDYKKKILAKGEELSKGGSIYVQKVIAWKPFIGFAFMKIDQSDVQTSLKAGIAEVLRYLSKLEQPKIQSIVFPISEELGCTQTILNQLLEHIEGKAFKTVYVTTKSSSCFLTAMRKFSDIVEKLSNENQICID